ncbi:MAG: hypothetical protein JXR88_09710 [Clostridia bacterium]|nr:hypothetical protein [Clostridia bacterium]
MSKVIKNGDLEHYPIDGDNSFNMNIKVIQNFTLWANTTHEEVHLVMSGNPIININNQFITLDEGDVLSFDSNESYRYFSKGSSMVFTFKHR